MLNSVLDYAIPVLLCVCCKVMRSNAVCHVSTVNGSNQQHFADLFQSACSVLCCCRFVLFHRGLVASMPQQLWRTGRSHSIEMSLNNILKYTTHIEKTQLIQQDQQVQPPTSQHRKRKRKVFLLKLFYPKKRNGFPI